MTPDNACQLSALSEAIMQQPAGGVVKVATMTSIPDIAEANLTGASRVGVLQP